MKKSLVFAMAMAMGLTASAYAANPFSDVPAGHWAYDSIASLASSGVIDGYGTTFGGEKLMTRYEMAQVVAKAMAKGANCDKLAAEFSDELDALGVRVAKLEKKVDNVKITGQIRYSYKNHGEGHTGHASDGYNRFRTRLFVNGQINNNWSYTGMLENNRFLDKDSKDGEQIYLRRAFVSGRVGGVKVTGGRIYPLQNSMYDQVADGIMASYSFDGYKVSGWAGKNLTGEKNLYTYVHTLDEDRVYNVKVEKTFEKLDAMIGYWKLYNEDDTSIFDLYLAYPVAKGFKLSGEYFNGKIDSVDDEDKNGYEFKLSYLGAKAAKPGTWGLYVSYQDRPYSTYINPTCLSAYANDVTGAARDGFKGWELGGSYTFAKNIVGDVKYFNYEARDVDNGHTHTIWGDVVFTF